MIKYCILLIHKNGGENKWQLQVGNHHHDPQQGHLKEDPLLKKQEDKIFFKKY
jgi:hypothetical protein